MKETETKLSIRWVYLVVGVIALLFAGIIYAWSILKAPLVEECGWSDTAMTVNFFLTMCFFCLGGMAASALIKKMGSRLVLILSAVLVCAGFILTSLLTAGSSVILLYITYGVLCGAGIGMAYNVLVSGIGAWFPDKKGFCSGCLMMGFGASSLVLGTLAESFIYGSIGWKTTYVILGVALGVVLVVVGLIFKRPAEGTQFPAPKAKAGKAGGEDFEVVDMTSAQMVKRFTFWRAFLCIILVCSLGNTVISIAKDLVISVGAKSIAATMVGILAVCNGLGRIITGALFDKLGRRKTMLLANVVGIVGAVVLLAAVLTGSVVLCVAGMCIAGLSYGTCPTISSAFTSAFYGTKHFASNFSIMNFNLMGASAIGMVCAGVLRAATGGFMVPFVVLLVLAAVALVLNISIRRP